MAMEKQADIMLGPEEGELGAGVIPWESVVADEKIVCHEEGGVEWPPPPAWIAPFDAFMNTKGAVTTLSFFSFFGGFSSAILVAMGLLVFRTGVRGMDPPLSAYTTLNHPNNQGIVHNVVLPALCGQCVLLVVLASTRDYGVVSETLLAAASAAAYAYVANRKEAAASIAWVGMLTCVLYGVAWISIVRTITRVPQRLGAVGIWVVLCTAAYCYVAILWLQRPDDAHGTTPVLLFLALCISQCMFIVPMVHKKYRDFEVVEYAD